MQAKAQGVADAVSELDLVSLEINHVLYVDFHIYKFDSQT